MSYLNTLRFHFAGRFFTNPSTINNRPDNYNNEMFNWGTTWVRGDEGFWNPKGANSFKLDNVSITSAIDADGNSAGTESDSLFTFQLESRGRNSAKLVDLDPDQQMVSMIFGLRLALIDIDGNIAFEGMMDPPAFSDLWSRTRSGREDEKLAAFYQSVITIQSWGDVSGSKVLQQLQQRATENILSIKFNVDSYSMDFDDQGKFAFGRIVGSIGAGSAAEPRHFIQGRQLNRPSAKSNFGVAVLDEGRKKLRIDLGNALPSDSSFGPVTDIGKLFLCCRKPDRSLVEIAPIPYGGTDWYAKTAGVVEVPANRLLSVDEMQQVQTRPLVIQSKLPLRRKIVNEETRGGQYVRADMFVGRMNPGDELELIFYATRLGKPLPNSRWKQHTNSKQDNLSYSHPNS